MKEFKKAIIFFKDMLLRAHHLLCIRNFKGKGYSPEFVRNYYEVLGRLTKANIKIVNSVDVICEKCPHNKGVCKKEKDSEMKTRKFDDRLIKTANIDLDEEYLYEDLKELVKHIKARDFCNDCEWKSLCTD
ncbi:hypothetical protein CMO93_01800 [Candidatus Woesearchaeota archaeon]|jgi:hypothetical protein|nr:hypothetical protein [Candidatus Woesearchaeota archaeon]|tara:strand:+ start:2961 stop:3353 length:393 start_codon:yes stop_codon:yes gene_type:complete